MTPTFQGEFQFRRYSDTSTQGQQVVFAVEDREALAAFIGKEGKRFMAVLVEIGDDEQPVLPSRKSTRGPLCREACELCKLPDFQCWAHAAADYVGEPSELSAKNAILGWCGVDSRKDLDETPVAAERFRTLVRVPFMRWQQQQRN